MISIFDLSRYGQAEAFKDLFGEKGTLFVDMSTGKFGFYFMNDSKVMRNATTFVNGAINGGRQSYEDNRSLTLSDLEQAFQPVGQHLDLTWLPIFSEV